MKTERTEKSFAAVYEAPQIKDVSIAVDAGFAASAETDPMTEVEGEW